MSTSVMAACWPLQMPPTPKAVLVSLADNANDQGHCWPSIPTICERTCFSERAVQSAIKWLEQCGCVVADRSNGRHTRYRLTPAGYAPPQEMRPRTTRTPANAAEPPQEMHQPPQEVPSNRQEPTPRATVKSKSSAAGKKPPAAREPIPPPPDWIDPEAWSGFVEMRKRQRFPLTARAAALVVRKLDQLREHGHDPTEVLDQSTRNAWRDVYAIKPEDPAHANRSPSRPRSVVERTVAGIRDRRAREAASAALLSGRAG